MLNAKNKIYLALIAFAILFSAFTLFALLPSFRSLKQTSQNLVLSKTTLALFDNQLVSLADFDKAGSGFSKYQQQIQDSFVDPAAPVAFIGFLESEVETTELQLRVTPFTLPQKESKKYSIGFDLVLKGGFAYCLRFLERLEQSPWLIEISDLSVSRISEAQLKKKEYEQFKEGDVQLSLEIKVISQI